MLYLNDDNHYNFEINKHTSLTINKLQLIKLNVKLNDILSEFCSIWNSSMIVIGNEINLSRKS